MPQKFDDILEGVKRNLKGKTNPRTKKPYTESEVYAIAQAQYQEWKEKHEKGISVFVPITKGWMEIVKTDNGDTKQKFFEATVSGMKEDRDGEVMDQMAIDDMIMQFKSGKIPLFPDHGLDPETGQRAYRWKQIMGVWTDARQEGENIIAVARLNNAHPDAELFWNYLQEGMPVGFSIGGRPVEVVEEETE